jgi:hypothetical protein
MTDKLGQREYSIVPCSLKAPHPVTHPLNQESHRHLYALWTSATPPSAMDPASDART